MREPIIEVDDFNSLIPKANIAPDNIEKVKELERQINTTAMLIKNVETYTRLKPVMEQRKKAKDKEQFAERHQAEIILFEAALKELKGAKYPPIKELNNLNFLINQPHLPM